LQKSKPATLDGISAEIDREGNIVTPANASQVLAKEITREAPMAFSVEKIVAQNIKKRGDIDLSKSR
jgi:hypothetical protein